MTDLTTQSLRTDTLVGKDAHGRNGTQQTGLSPKQLEWLRSNVAHFAEHADAAERARNNADVKEADL